MASWDNVRTDLDYVADDDVSLIITGSDDDPWYDFEQRQYRRCTFDKSQTWEVAFGVYKLIPKDGYRSMMMKETPCNFRNHTYTEMDIPKLNFVIELKNDNGEKQTIYRCSIPVEACPLYFKTEDELFMYNDLLEISHIDTIRIRISADGDIAFPLGRYYTLATMNIRMQKSTCTQYSYG